MLNLPLDVMASSVRLGVATLKVIRGVGERVSEVKEDIVIARGILSCVDVQTTTEWVRRRIMDRSCSGRGIAVSGWAVGGCAGAVCHDFDGESDV